MSRPTVTLCMIVKDEEHIIRECLESISPYIDRYDITDTGSTDTTKKVIKDYFDSVGIPGEVYDAPWEGFGKSRTQSLRNADKGGADYSWVIDADDKVEGNFKYPDTFGEHDGYALNIHRGDFNWWRNQIFKNNIGWQYVGVIHEYADSPSQREKNGNLTVVRLDGDYHIEARTMGNRTKGFLDDQCAKYLKDAETLHSCLYNPEDPNYDPTNLRYMFYLAQSYFDASVYDKAYDAYKVRAEAGGWEEEQWYCVYRMGICKCMEPFRQEESSWAEAQDHFLQAWNIRPQRIEPLYQLARIHRQNGNPKLGFLFAKSALGIPMPKDDILFLQREMSDWMIYDEAASTAHEAGDFDLGLQCSQKLISENLFPEEHRERITNNFRAYLARKEMIEKAIAEQQQQQQQVAAQEKIDKAETLRKKEEMRRVNKRRGKKVRVR